MHSNDEVLPNLVIFYTAIMEWHGAQSPQWAARNGSINAATTQQPISDQNLHDLRELMGLGS